MSFIYFKEKDLANIGTFVLVRTNLESWLILIVHILCLFQSTIETAPSGYMKNISLFNNDYNLYTHRWVKFYILIYKSLSGSGVCPLILETTWGGPILFWTKLKIHAICCLKNMLYSRRKWYQERLHKEHSRYIYPFCYNSPVYSVQHANKYIVILLRVTAE